MAVLGRVLVSSAERLDLPDFLSIDSFTQGDFKYLMQSFVGSSKPYVLKGFDVINPGSAIGTQNVSIRVANSVVYYPSSLAGPFFHGLEEGNIQSAPLIPELRKNSTNYVYLTLTTSDAAKDTRAFWDPDKEGGAGGEFTQDVNTQTVLSVAVNVSASAFPDGTTPICKVVVGANFIESIEDARDMMFRLGTGGLNPNPLATYAFRSEPSADYARNEPNTLMNNVLNPNPFQGGDKNIKSLKEWMDVVMTKLLELSGTSYWYENTSSFSITNMFNDVMSTSIKSKGNWQSSDSTPGLLTWTEDITLQSVVDKKDVIIRNNAKTLLDGQVMYVRQNRGNTINTGSIAVEWFNNVNYVNGTLGSFENLTKGDWVKKSDDSDSLYLRVEEFYANTNLAGGVTAPGTALSIKLSDVYGGLGETKQGVYTQGEYLTTDVSVANRDDTTLADAGGDMYWLAIRSDKILDISDITSTQLTVDITAHNGIQALCTSTAHGLADLQRIQIVGSTNFDGIYKIEVIDANSFYIQLGGGPFADELAQSCFYATVTTTARTTNNGYELESENHTLKTDQKVTLSNTTNFNGSFNVYPTGNTTFTIPVAGLIGTEGAGAATSVEIYVRTDIGPTKLNQGANKGVGSVETANLMSFIGMDSQAQTYPTYHISGNYNTLNGTINYNSLLSDNLTQRVSKLTSMIADKTQDKTITATLHGVKGITNITNAANQDITFVQKDLAVPMTITLSQPSSVGNCVITIDGSISLAANQTAYASIDRNAATAALLSAAINVVDTAAVPLDENVFIIASRLTGTEVSLWDGEETNNFADANGAGGTLHYIAEGDLDVTAIKKLDESLFTEVAGISTGLANTDSRVRQNNNLKLVAGGTWHWNIGAVNERQTFTFSSIPTTGTWNLNDGSNTTSAIAFNADTATIKAAIETAFTTNSTIVNVTGDYASGIVIEILSSTHATNNYPQIVSSTSALDATIVDGTSQSGIDAVNQLTFDSDAYIRIPGLPDTRNTISAQTLVLKDGDVAYVTINRTVGATTVLPVTVAQVGSIVLTDDIVTIAQRVGSDLLVGTDAFSLADKERLQLDAALEEINKYFGQLRIVPHESLTQRVKITNADITKLDTTVISQAVKNLLLNFNGAEINFQTGEVLGADGFTPLGINFTPTIPATGQYRWLSITLSPGTVNADNTINGQLIVLAGSTDGATKDITVKPAFSKGTQLGMVAITSVDGANISPINYGDIIQLGVGGGGSGGSGDANELLERLKNINNTSEYDVCTPVIYSTSEETLTDPTTTAKYDVANSFYNMTVIGEFFASVQMADSTFLSENKDIAEIDLHAFWDLNSLDTAAAYEVSRDGGNEFQTVTMDRIGGSDTFTGKHIFAPEASFSTVIENAVTSADASLVFDVTTEKRSQVFTVATAMTLKQITAYFTSLGTIQGNICIQIIADNSGSPSTNGNDILYQSTAQNLSSLVAGDHAITVTGTIALNAGDYHLVVSTDLEYRDNYSAGVNQIALRTVAAGTPVSNKYQTGVWSAAAGQAVYLLEGRVLDLRVRITASADAAATSAGVDLLGFGIEYDKNENLAFAGAGYERQVITFNGSDNTNTFNVTEFTPDPILINVHELLTGQIYRRGAFTIDNGIITFPANTFNKPGEVITLEFLQVFKGSMQFDSLNRAIMAENHLGSLNPSLDLSAVGRGIILRRPDGTLREITINNNDNIDIKSVP